MVTVTPCPWGILMVTEDILEFWRKPLLDNRFDFELAMSLMLYHFRYCFIGYLTAHNRLEFPGMFPTVHEESIPVHPLYAITIGHYRVSRRDNCPALVCDVPNFIQRFDAAVVERGWRVATMSEFYSSSHSLKNITAVKNVQWFEPLKVAADMSWLSAGVLVDGIDPPPLSVDKIRPWSYGNLVDEHGAPFSPVISVVNFTGGSYDFEQFLGRLQPQYFEDHGKGQYFAILRKTESAAFLTMASHKRAYKPWTYTDYFRDFFGPLMAGRKLLSSPGN
jgi:hypothetical protein